MNPSTTEEAVQGVTPAPAEQTSASSEEVRAQRTLISTIRRNPLAALKDLSTGKPPKGVLFAMATLCLIEPRVRRLGSAKVFIQYIVDGYVEPDTELEPAPTPELEPSPSPTPELGIEPQARTISEEPEPNPISAESTPAQESKPDPELPELTSKSKPRPWETPLMGLVNIVAAIKKDKSPSRLDVKVIDEIRAAYPSIIAAIYRDLSNIMLPGRDADIRRHLLARAICLFAGLDGMRLEVYDESTVSLVMHCWLYMSPTFEYRQYALFAVHALFENVGGAPPGIKQLAVETVSVDVLCQRFVSMLRLENFVDAAFEDELWAFFQFATMDHPLALTFVHEAVYADIAGALQYQLHHGSEKWTYDIFNLSHQIINAMLSITPAPEKMTRFTHMVEASILEVAAAGLIIADKNKTEDWFAFTGRFTHTLQCTNEDCEYKVTPEFRAAAFKAFEPLYVPVRVVLNKTVGSKALALWDEIAALLDISEGTIREQWRKEKECGDPYCPNRGEDLKRMACTRCHTIFYCDRECQKRDWKNHKPHCVKKAPPTKAALEQLVRAERPLVGEVST